MKIKSGVLTQKKGWWYLVTSADGIKKWTALHTNPAAHRPLHLARRISRLPRLELRRLEFIDLAHNRPPN